MTVRIIQGDCRDVLATLDAESVDACCTDPPYGLEFMGKEWDRLWDKRAGTERAKLPGTGSFRNSPTYEAGGTAQDWHEGWAREVYRVLKPGAHLVAFGGPRTFHRLTCGVEDAGFEVRDCLCWLFGSGFPKSHNLPGGLGTALKPAWEPIILARKPLIGTVAANVARYGTGALNIDGCRIDSMGEEITTHSRGASEAYPKRPGERTVAESGRSVAQNGDGLRANPHMGRWPANVLLDEEASALLDAQAGERKSGSGGRQREMTSRGYRGGGLGQRRAADHLMTEIEKPGYGDTGGPSRFFYTAKASRAERNKGLEGMPDRFTATMNDGIGAREHNESERNAWTKNHHPTVKPVSLMQWLVRLVTPNGGIILDPFAGSGTTGIAADREGFDAILIEREAEYVEIMRHRIEGDAPLLTTLTLERG